MIPSLAYINQMTPFIGATLFALACVGVDFGARRSRLWGRDLGGSALKEASANLPFVYIPVIGAFTLEGRYDPLYLVVGITCALFEIALFLFLQEGPRAVPHEADDRGRSSQPRPTLLLVGIHVFAAFLFGIFWIWQPNHPPEQRSESVKVTPPEPRPVPSAQNPSAAASKDPRVALRAPKANIVIPDSGKFTQAVTVAYEDVPRTKHLWLVVKGIDMLWTYGTCEGDGGSVIDLARYHETDTWSHPELPIGSPNDEAEFTLFVLLVDDFHNRALAKEYKINSVNCAGTPWKGRADVLKDGTVLTSKTVRRRPDLPKQ